MNKGLLRIAEVSKKIICMIIVLVMLAGNFIVPVQSIAADINAANANGTVETSDGNGESAGNEENAQSEENSNEADNVNNQAKIEEIEAAFEASQQREQAGNNENEEGENAEDNQPAQQNNTRALRNSAPVLRTNNASAASDRIEDRLTPDIKDETTVKTKNDAYEINTFNTQFVSGATKDENNNLVWTPTSTASGHEFRFRINYALSGLKEHPAEAIKITIPKQILRNRDGNFAGKYEMSLPKNTEYDGTTEFAYIENGDYIVIYNPDPVKAAVNGYIEVSYFTNTSTTNYRDYDKTNTDLVTNGGTASDPFNAVITVKTTVRDNEDVLANVSDDKNLFIDTIAKIQSTQKYQPTIYRDWNNSWTAEVPADKDDYYYLIWQVVTNIQAGTQPYTFSLQDTITNLTEGTNADDYQFVGYKLSGERYFSDKNTDTTASTGTQRTDYVLTRHKKATFTGIDYQLKNTVTATVNPLDQVDPSTNATSSNIFSWSSEFRIPTGHFNLFKYGNNNWSGRYWDYANYDLDKLQSGEVNELKGFKYLTSMVGYAWPWTLKEGGSSNNPEDYGYNPVNYDTWDDTLYLENDENPMNYEDYYLEYFTYTISNQDANYDDFYNKFNTTSATYANDEILTFYGKFADGQDWIQIGTLNLKTKEITFDDTYVQSMTTDKVTFKDGVHATGWRYTTTNKHYYTGISVTPYFVLTNSDYVMEKIADKDKIQIKNIVKTNITDYKNETIFEAERAAIDYARVTYYDSKISKTVSAGSNNVIKKRYDITWKINAYETATGGNGDIEYIRQESGKFYDLIPSGGELDLNSIQVQTEKGFLPENEYTYETIPNYNNTGRTMLIINIDEQAQYYTVYYKTIHSWESMHDFGRSVLNPVAYETGNEKITKGFPDNGGNLSEENKALFTDLDNTTDANKFIYAEQPHNINALTATVSGLYKKVKSAKDTDYKYDTIVESNGKYSYQLRYQNTFMNKSKNLILFDSLENFEIVDSDAGTTKTSGWKGTLQSIDVSQLRQKGIDPVIYISTVENLDIEAHNDLADTSIWTKATFLTDLSEAKAIAIDARKDTNGNDYLLESGDSISATLNMRAPIELSEQAEQNPYVYNNVYLKGTLLDEEEEISDFLIHQDYTTIKYYIMADVPLVKVNEEDTNEKIKGITFRLWGTSNYGTDVDVLVTSDKNGRITFKDIELGEYKLQEYETNEDWLIDYTEHQVRITRDKDVYIDNQLVANDVPFEVTNKPRIHADVEFAKRNTASKAALEGVKFRLSGTSEYGNEVLAYKISDQNGKVSFKDLEYGIYELIETNTLEGYIPNNDKYRVVVDENGNVDILIADKENGEIYTSIYDKGNFSIYNEPLHSFTFIKKDEYSGENIAGAKFRVYGVSDYGNNYSKEETTSSIGFVEFTDLESGTYILQETYVPEVTDNQDNPISYVLDETKYIVTIEKDGKFNIDGVEKNEYGYYVIYNKRNKGQITITKKWNDESNNNERPEPIIHISNEKPEAPLRVQYFRNNRIITSRDIRGPLYDALGSNYTYKITGTFARNTTLSEEEVKNLGAKRVDIEYSKSDAEYKIYAWIDDEGNCWWWSNADVALLTDNSNKMFYYWHAVKSIDLSGIDVSNVTNMRDMFAYCYDLTELNLSSFNTENVTNMYQMFRGCAELTELDLSSFDTSNVTNMYSMFYDCRSLTELDLSSFDTSNVTNMGSMFTYCSNLKTIYVSDSFDTNKATSSSGMFSICTSIIGGNGTTYNSSYTDKTYARIDKPDQPGYFTEKSTSSGSTNNMQNNIQTAATSKNIKNILGLNNTTTEITKTNLNKPLKLLAPETVGGDESNDGSSETLIYSTAETNYDDEGNEVHWIKNGDTWTYTFYVDDPYATWYVWEDEMNGYNTNYDIYNPGTVENQTATVINYTQEKENEVTIEFGNLSISKTLILRGQSGNTTLTSDEDNTEFAFTVKLTAEAGKESTISGTKVFGDYVFKDGVATVKLHAGEIVTINGLPAGVTYSVTEKEINGYETFAGANGTIVKDETSAVETVNYKDEAEDDPTPGEEEKFVSFTVAKQVTGNGEVDEQYTIEIVLDNLKPDTTYALSNGETFVSDSIGSANITVSLGNNESITVQNIPVGAKYKVYEHAGDYISSYVITDANNAGMINNTAKNNTKENKELSTNTETADEGEDVTITFTNKKVVTQNLKVQKTVTDPEDTNSYIFEIEFANLEEGTSFNSTVGRSVEEDGKAELTIYLAGGEEAEFYNVPVGTTYTVKELASSAIASYTVTDANGTNQIVSESKSNTTAKKALSTARETVNQGEEVTVTFINDTVNQEPDSVSASLGVTKVVVNEDGEVVNNCDETFTFELTTDNEENPMPENSSVRITGNGTASFGTIAFSETGTYTYTVVEKAGDNDKCTYDDAKFTIVYEVTNAEGLLEVTKVVKKNGFESDVVEFTNVVEKEDEPEPVEPTQPDEPEEPTEPTEPEDNKEEPENKDEGEVEPAKPASPQTGDNIIMIMSILVVAGVVVAITFKKRK